MSEFLQHLLTLQLTHQSTQVSFNHTVYLVSPVFRLGLCRIWFHSMQCFSQARQYALGRWQREKLVCNREYRKVMPVPTERCFAKLADPTHGDKKACIFERKSQSFHSRLSLTLHNKWALNYCIYKSHLLYYYIYTILRWRRGLTALHRSFNLIMS